MLITDTHIDQPLHFENLSPKQYFLYHKWVRERKIIEDNSKIKQKFIPLELLHFRWLDILLRRKSENFAMTPELAKTTLPN